MLFPLESCRDYFSKRGWDLDGDENAISILCELGELFLTVEEVDRQGPKGRRVVEDVNLRLVLHDPPNLSDVHAGEINRFATISSLQRDAENQWEFSTGISILETDAEVAARIFAPMIANEATLINWHAKTVLAGEDLPSHDLSPLGQPDEPPEWLMQELTEAGERLRAAGYWAGVKRGLEIEFPLDEGALSHIFRLPAVKEKMRSEGKSEEEIERMGGRTCTAKIGIASHPYYGKGLLASLEDHQTIKDFRAAYSVARSLNQMERLGRYNPSRFGSWCVGQRALSHASFIPAALLVEGLPIHLAFWTVARSMRLRAFYEDAGEQRH